MFNKINTRGVIGGYGFTYSFVAPSMMTDYIQHTGTIVVVILC